ncbi:MULTISPECIES: hypothetical protein [Alphaproteobacteria]
MTMEEKMAAANAKFLAESQQVPPEPQPTPAQVMAEVAAQAEPAP